MNLKMAEISLWSESQPFLPGLFQVWMGTFIISLWGEKKLENK